MIENSVKKLIAVNLFLAALVLVLFSLIPSTSNAASDWQVKQLYEPSDWQLEREQRGLVNIYSGFTDRQVAMAMDTQFDRIDNMMFVNTVVTKDDGEPKRDEATGEAVTEDDGC